MGGGGAKSNSCNNWVEQKSSTGQNSCIKKGKKTVINISFRSKYLGLGLEVGEQDHGIALSGNGVTMALHYPVMV